MKKQFLLGMAVVVSVTAASSAFAAGAPAARPNIAIRETYVRNAQKEIEMKAEKAGLKVSAYGEMKRAEKAQLHELLLKETKLEGSVSKAALEGALNKRFSEAMDVLKTAKALDSMIAEAVKAKAAPELIESAKASKEAMITLLNLANKIDAFEKPASMTKEQFENATAGLNKLLIEAPKTATKYDAAEASGVIKVVESIKEVMKENRSLTPQEAFVEGVMRAKKISREEALKLLEKYKDCI